MHGYDEPGYTTSDEDGGLWQSSEQAVPPVIGRFDPYTGRPSLRYETDGEVADEVDRDASFEEYDTEDGANVTISF